MAGRGSIPLCCALPVTGLVLGRRGRLGRRRFATLASFFSDFIVFDVVLFAIFFLLPAAFSCS